MPHGRPDPAALIRVIRDDAVDDDALGDAVVGKVRVLPGVGRRASDGCTRALRQAKKVINLPTPGTSVNIEGYEQLYVGGYRAPVTYVRHVPRHYETGDIVEYDLEREDEEWLERHPTARNVLDASKLEVILDLIEKADAATPTAPKLEDMDDRILDRIGITKATAGRVLSDVLSY